MPWHSLFNHGTILGKVGVCLVVRMIKLGIVADDLTGANDTGVQFAKVGLRTLVIWKPDLPHELLAEYDVVVIDTETRGKPMEEAYEEAYAAATAVNRSGATYFYKKVDSTMRGNIGAELDAMLDALQVSLAIVSPAYPRNGRTMVDGRLLVGGVPLERTEAARDPITPVSDSNVQLVLKRQSRRMISSIPLTTIAEGPEYLKEFMQRERLLGTEVFVADATSEADLETIAQAASSLGETVLLCGSAGLAEKMPLAFGLLPREGGVLVLAGTASSVTARQIDFLERTHGARVVTVDPQRVFGGEEQRNREVTRSRRIAKEALDKGGDVVVRWASSFAEAEKSMKLTGLSDAQDMSRVALSTLVAIATTLINRSLSGLVLTGGDTAMSFVDSLGAMGIGVTGEVESGVPAVTIVGGKWDGMRVVTKAGGFGDEMTLVRIVQYLRRAKRH
jgi:uncharacterized protein YgbK (DUF1537 family)